MYLCTENLVLFSASHAARVMKSEVECGLPVPKGCRPLGKANVLQVTFT
jgi:hypothetical protein